jgi:hypothetical protein
MEILYRFSLFYEDREDTFSWEILRFLTQRLKNGSMKLKVN